MPHYEGLVTSLKEDGKAEVIIQPGSTGIPGASPQVNRRVCHCATVGSTIMIEALNRAGADVGDRVFVSRDTSALVKNAFRLLGIPAIGIIVGIVIAYILTHGFTFHIIGGILAIGACLMLGIVLGVSAFAKVSPGSQPVIERIIKTRLEATSMYSEKQCTGLKGDRSCDGCSGPF